MEKEGIYLGGKKDFLAPFIFDIDSVSNYDLDNQTVESYINGVPINKLLFYTITLLIGIIS